MQYNACMRSSDSEKALDEFPYRAYCPAFLSETYFAPFFRLLLLWNSMCVVSHDCTVMIFLVQIDTQLMLLETNLGYPSAIISIYIQNSYNYIVSFADNWVTFRNGSIKSFANVLIIIGIFENLCEYLKKLIRAFSWLNSVYRC